MKRTTFAFLLSFAVLAGPAAAGHGGGHRGEARAVQRQASVAQRHAERAQQRGQRGERAAQRRSFAVKRQRPQMPAQRVLERAQRRAEQHQQLTLRQQQRQALAFERQAVREQRRAFAFEQQQRRALRRQSFMTNRPAFRRPFLVGRDRAFAPGPRRFRGLDFNGDGMVTRDEWRGNNRSFANHDWNGDGVLSGNEVIAGGARPVRVPFFERFLPLPRRLVAPVPLGVLVPAPSLVTFEPLPALDVAFPVRLDEPRLQQVVRVQGFAPVEAMVAQFPVTPIDQVLIADRFVALDVNRDRFVAVDEWSGPRPLFRTLDVNRDRLLAPTELVVTNPAIRRVELVDRDRFVAFDLLDQDNDGVIAPWEWTGDMDVFFLLDVDNDGVVEQPEYLGLVRVRPVPVRFIAGGALDLDHNGFISRAEWVGDPFRFAALDLNHDGRVKPIEGVIGTLLAQV